MRQNCGKIEKFYDFYHKIFSYFACNFSHYGPLEYTYIEDIKDCFFRSGRSMTAIFVFQQKFIERGRGREEEGKEFKKGRGEGKEDRERGGRCARGSEEERREGGITIYEKRQKGITSPH
jgi:hypothetical protein